MRRMEFYKLKVVIVLNSKIKIKIILNKNIKITL